MSKRKQVQGSLYSFFGGKQSHDKEINTTSETPAPNKKTCKFQESWKDKYKWLRFGGKENKIFCEFCREFLNSNDMQYSLKIGTNNFQTDSIKAQAGLSEGHAMSSAAKRASERPTEERPIPEALARLDEESFKKMEFLFNTAYYLVYLKLPFSIFSQLCSLQRKNGLSLGNTYMNDQACKESSFANTSLIHSRQIYKILYLLLSLYLLWLMEQQMSHV